MWKIFKFTSFLGKYIKTKPNLVYVSNVENVNKSIKTGSEWIYFDIN